MRVGDNGCFPAVVLNVQDGLFQWPNYLGTHRMQICCTASESLQLEGRFWQGHRVAKCCADGLAIISSHAPKQCGYGLVSGKCGYRRSGYWPLLVVAVLWFVAMVALLRASQALSSWRWIFFIHEQLIIRAVIPDRCENACG
jgi:hypothetical protein